MPFLKVVNYLKLLILDFPSKKQSHNLTGPGQEPTDERIATQQLMPFVPWPVFKLVFAESVTGEGMVPISATVNFAQPLLVVMLLLAKLC